MILYKRNQNDFLIPTFIGMIMVLMNFVPVHAFLNAKSTNTDALPATQTMAKLERISLPEKTATNEIEVPVLGNIASDTVNYSVANVSYASVCASTPTPGYNQISVCGRVIPLYYSNSYANVTPADGYAVKYTKRNFVFGHNSYDVFGGLQNLLKPGDPLIINLDGVETTYHFETYWLNTSSVNVDAGVKPANGSDALGIMTCAPWVVNGLADSSRLDYLFRK